MNKYIQSIVGTRGWLEIEKMFNDAIKQNTAIDSTVSDEVLIREYRAGVIANEKLIRLLNKIKLSGGLKETKQTGRYI